MRTIRTNAVRQHFLDELARRGNVRETCRVLRLSRDAVYRWRAEDEMFAAEWDVKLGMAAQALEAEARRRAMAGSDPLLMFLLRSLKPEVYGRRSIRDLSPDRHDDYHNLSLPELQRRLDELQRLQTKPYRRDDPGSV